MLSTVSFALILFTGRTCVVMGKISYVVITVLAVAYMAATSISKVPRVHFKKVKAVCYSDERMG